VRTDAQPRENVAVFTSAVPTAIWTARALEASDTHIRRLAAVLLNTAYNATSGERVYQQRIADRGGAFTASPVGSDGKIYLSSEDGDVFVFKAGPKHELLSVNPMGEVLMATPAISDGMLIVRGINHVFAIAEPAAAPPASAAK